MKGPTLPFFGWKPEPERTNRQSIADGYSISRRDVFYQGQLNGASGARDMHGNAARPDFRVGGMRGRTIAESEAGAE
jgi:hypothetical protein